MNFNIVKDFSKPGVISKAEHVEPDMFPDVLLSATGNIKVLSTIPNLEVLLNSYGIDARYNLISKDTEIILPWSNQADLNNVISEIISQCNMNGFPKGDVPQFVESIAAKNEYNPISDWIKSQSWDGKDRFSQVLDCIEVPEKYEHAKKIYLKRWCFSAIGMLDNDGTKSYEGVLVFQGEQGLGKTRWIKGLVGEMSVYFKDGLVIDPHSKDSVATAISHWIVEIGELDATFKKSDIAALKAFFTSSKDRFRRAYAAKDTVFPRRTVFFASVNDQQFLKDSTGDRRYWCLPTKSLDLPKDYNAQQFWAQMQHIYNSENSTNCTEKWYLTSDEIEFRNSLNDDFRETNPIEEAIVRKFPVAGEIYLLTSTDVAKLLDMQPTQSTIAKIGRELKKLYGEPKRTSRARYYKMPLPENMHPNEIRHLGFEKYGSLI